MSKYYSSRNKLYQRRYRRKHKAIGHHQSYRDDTHVFIKHWANAKDHRDIQRWLDEYKPVDERKPKPKDN